MWKQLSEELAGATAKAAQNLVHVGGAGVSGRTGLVWGDGLVVTFARQAEDGEAVPVVLPGGTEVAGRVKAWDPRTGLAVLEVPGVSEPHWTIGALPAVGSLALTVAFPSPQGPEARLDAVRFAGPGGEWGRGVSLDGLIQTDGNPYPGFTGAAVVDADGALVGWVADNRPGNGGWAASAADLKRLADALVRGGSPAAAWLGVTTRPAGGQGLALAAVDPDSPAFRAGWKAGDLLVSLAGRPLREPSDLVGTLAGLTVGTEVPARLLRDGEVADWPVTPAPRP